MIYKFNNIKTLQYEVQSVFNFTDNSWLDKFYQSVGMGLNLIGITGQYKKVAKTFNVTDNRISLPTHLNSIIAITVGCCKVDLDNSLLEADCPTEICGYTVDSKLKASIQGNILYTNFNKKTTVYYWELPLDEDGLPLIPNLAEYSEALSWYVIYRLLLGGYKHHTIKDWREALQMWNTLKIKAENMGSMYDPDLARRLYENVYMNYAPNYFK